MNPFIWNWDITTGSALSGQICTDGTYVYAETRDSSMNHYFAKWNSATGVRLAYVVFTQAAGNNWSGPLMTDGTYLVACASDGVHAFLCSDLSHVGLVASSTSDAGCPNGFIGSLGHYDGTYFWFGGLNWGGGRNWALNRLTPGTWALAQIGSVSIGGAGNHTRAVMPCGADDLIVWDAGMSGIKRVRKDGTTVWANLGFGGSINGAVYDPATDRVFACSDNCELVAMQASDGQFVQRSGTVGGIFSDAAITGGHDGDAAMSGALGVGIVGETVISGCNLVNPGTTSRRATALPFRSGGFWGLTGAYPATPGPCWNWCVTGTRAWGAFGIGWRYGGAMYADYNVVTVVPKLTNVTPRAGKGLGLVFDNPVGLVGPTIGAPVDGVGVPAVTQTDTTHIDVDIDVPPTHPLGEATVSDVPAPTGVGAYLL